MFWKAISVIPPRAMFEEVKNGKLEPINSGV
jgi:hypothetical protein